MANENRGKILNIIQQNYVGIAVILVVFLLFIPMPKVLIDLSMILNLAFAFIVLMAVLYTPRASDFQTYPRIILIQTLFGLAINISSTRLILVNKAVAGGFSKDQSSMVQAFSAIVAGNDTVIGLVIFIILVIVQVLVITKGSTRVSEVAARFSLDSMSQKFFDVDNRLNTGAIDDQEAMRQKDAIRKEIDFYSNMDGASKFVSGNVVAGLVITFINLIGGFAIGMVRNNMTFGGAFDTYSKLTIGDGLMSQLPSLVISFATGILVTGTKSDDNIAEQLRTDFTRSGYIYIIVGAVIALSGFFLRNGTQVLLLPVGALFVYFGVRLYRNQEKEAVTAKQKAAEESQKKASAPSEEDNSITLLDSLSLELGYALIPLVNKEKGAELLERITRIRNEAKLDMGFVIPKIRILDNMTLEPDEYSFKIKGIERGRAKIRLGYYMCMNTGSVIHELEGERTKDPAFGMDAIWLPEDRRQEAENAGYVVVDPPTIIATHLTEIIRAHASEMLGRKEVSEIIEVVKKNNKVLVDEVMDTAQLNYGQIQQVLKNLLDEKVSIRNIITILETMANFAGITKDPWVLTEKVRESLGLQICMQYADPADHKLRVLTLSPTLSQMVNDNGYMQNGSKPMVVFDPVDNRKWINAVSGGMSKVTQSGFMPIILCPDQIRQLVHSALERTNPGVVVLSQNEVMAAGNSVSVEIIGEIKEENAGEEGI